MNGTHEIRRQQSMTASFNKIMLQLRKSGAWTRAGRSNFQVTPANFAQQRTRNNALAIGTPKLATRSASAIGARRAEFSASATVFASSSEKHSAAEMAPLALSLIAVLRSVFKT
jgi:hypothetical protein